MSKNPLLARLTPPVSIPYTKMNETHLLAHVPHTILFLYKALIQNDRNSSFLARLPPPVFMYYLLFNVYYQLGRNPLLSHSAPQVFIPH